MAETVVDTRAIEQLGRDIEKAKRQMIGRLGERGYQLLREEVPKVSRNLMQGVAAPEVRVPGPHPLPIPVAST